VIVALLPAHKPAVLALVPDKVGAALIVRLVPLSVPVTAGLLLITLILYPVPETAFAGIVALIVPELALLTNVPIAVGEAKEPDASDNWAVYVLLL
jgi:hypothetical protein